MWYFTLFLVFSLNDLSEACCPDGWISYSTHCYWIGYDMFMTFVEAEHYCVQHGAHLVQVDNSAENSFLKDLLRKTKAHYTWLGLTDETTEGVYKWYSTNQNTNYFDWASGDPNGNYEDCVTFFDKADYKWADFPCDTKVMPLCEKRSPEEVNVIG